MRLKTLKIALLTALILTLPACGTRTVLPRAGDPVRLRQDVKVKIWVFDKNGEMIESETVAPEGWYLLPDPGN